MLPGQQNVSKSLTAKNLVILVTILSLVVIAEEYSVLSGASVVDYDLSLDISWGANALIDGNFKSKLSTTAIDI